MLIFRRRNAEIFGETGNSLFSKNVYSPSIYFDPHPHPVKSSFCAGFQFSRDPIHGFNDRKKKKTRKNRAEKHLRMCEISWLALAPTAWAPYQTSIKWRRF